MDSVHHLRPCPFCGSDMDSFAGMTPAAFAKGPSDFAVNCDCGSMGPFAPTMEGAVAAWNTRRQFESASSSSDGFCGHDCGHNGDSVVLFPRLNSHLTRET